MSKKKEIPKSFELFGTTYNVVFDQQELEKEDCFGLHEAPKSLITLAKQFRDTEYSEDFITESFYHELAHALMTSMGEMKLNKNEKFIEILGKLLMQFNKTAKY